MPHLAVDLVVLSAAIVSRLQGIVSRELEPGVFAVVTVGSLQIGTKSNVIAERGVLLLNMRTYDEDVRQQLRAAIERIARAECQASRLPREPTFEYYEQFPLTDNDPDVMATVHAAFEVHVGPERVKQLDRLTGSEDFSRLPAAFAVTLVAWAASTSLERNKEHAFIDFALFKNTTFTRDYLELPAQRHDRHALHQPAADPTRRQETGMGRPAPPGTSERRPSATATSSSHSSASSREKLLQRGAVQWRPVRSGKGSYHPGRRSAEPRHDRLLVSTAHVARRARGSSWTAARPLRVQRGHIRRTDARVGLAPARSVRRRPIGPHPGRPARPVRARDPREARRTGRRSTTEPSDPREPKMTSQPSGRRAPTGGDDDRRSVECR